MSRPRETCIICDSQYKIVKGHKGECQWCRGWHRCGMCDRAKPLSDFTQYHPGDGSRQISTKCRQCMSSLRTGKFETRAEVFATYHIEGRLLRIWQECAPAYLYQLQRITRARKGLPPEKHPTSPDEIMARHRLEFHEWLRVSQALCEVSKTESWSGIPVGGRIPVGGKIKARAA